MIEAIKHFLGIGEEAAGRRTAAAIGLLMFAAIGAAGLAGAMLSGTDCTPNAPDPNCSSDLSPTLSPPMSPPMSPPVTPTTTTTTVDATSTTAAPTTTLLPTTTSTTASTTG